YWSSKGVRFYIVTDKELDRTIAQNIMWVRETLLDKQINDKEELANELYHLLTQNKYIPINSLLKAFDNDKHRNGIGLFIFRYLVANKIIKINMKNHINLDKK